MRGGEGKSDSCKLCAVERLLDESRWRCRGYREMQRIPHTTQYMHYYPTPTNEKTSTQEYDVTLYMRRTFPRSTT
jgi:hypothetical protein